MTAHSSDAPVAAPQSRRTRSSVATDRRGAVLVVVALALIVVLASLGLAIDVGRGYVTKMRLARAVDAGALAAARTLRQGQVAARTEAEAVARANQVAIGIGNITTSLAFGTNDRGESTVTFTADRTLPTTFTQVVGIRDMAIQASAVAAVPPLDVVLVLDTSGSLATAGAWDALQDAAADFVRQFNDQLDQVGLVSFQLTAHQRVMLRHNFTLPVTQDIAAMSSAGDTNIGEGLRLARLQLQSGAARPNAAKVVVFFTDGRATAFRRDLGNEDRVLGVFANGGPVRGYFDNPNSLPPFAISNPNGCQGSGNCFGFDAAQVRAEAAAYGASQANLIRQDDTLIYTIGLGDLNYPPNDLRVPDLDYLRLLANENGVASSSQPEGRMFFAPSAAQLEEVFNEVARDLIVRLAG